jgi:hypothetical protein
MVDNLRFMIVLRGLFVIKTITATHNLHATPIQPTSVAIPSLPTWLATE